MLSTALHEFPFTAPAHDLQDFPLPALDALLATTTWSGWSWERPRTTWIEPRLIAGVEQIEPYVASHLLLLRDAQDPSQIVAVYPVSSGGVHATLSSARCEESEAAGLYLRCRKVTSSPSNLSACVIVVRSSNGPRETHTIVAKAVQLAREWLYRVEHAGKPGPFVGLDPTSPVEGVGFCTWSSIGEGVKPTVTNLTSLLDSLTAAKFPIQSFMLDDGWLDTRHYIDSNDGTEYADIPGWNAALWGFEAASSLGTTVGGIVDLIKRKIPTVRDVGVWMTLEGYWKGIHPDSPLVQKYEFRPYALNRAYMPGITNEPGNVTYLPTGHGTWFLPSPTHAYSFWHDWFTYLAREGVTWVKVDNQASMSFLAGTEGAEAHTAMWEGMTRAAEDVWGSGAVVYCMSHSERMYNGDAGLGVATKGKKMVVRNSDDFGLGWRHNAHQLHIFHNVYTSILTSQLCHVPDPDMFMTAAQLPVYHALLRALFPGPLLLSDKKGEHDLEVVHALVGYTANGEPRVVKSREAVRPLANRIFPTAPEDHPVGTSDGPPVVGYVSYPSLQSATIAAWNTRDRDHPGKSAAALNIVDILDALERPVGEPLDGEYVLFRHGYTAGLDRANPSPDGQVALVSPEMEESTPLMAFTLEHNACEAFTVAKLHTLQSGGQTVRVAPLGLVDKFAGLSGLKSVNGSKDTLTCQIEYDGTLGFIVLSPDQPDAALHVLVDDTVVTFSCFPADLVGNDVDSARTWLVRVPITQTGTGGDHWTVKLTIGA